MNPWLTFATLHTKRTRDKANLSGRMVMYVLWFYEWNGGEKAQYIIYKRSSVCIYIEKE